MPTSDDAATRLAGLTGRPAELGVGSGADAVLDIAAETCPMTFVRTRLALDRLAPGQTLLVLLRGEEPRARVPATVVSLGHEILARNETADGRTSLLIRRA